MKSEDLLIYITALGLLVASGFIGGQVNLRLDIDNIVSNILVYLVSMIFVFSLFRIGFKIYTNYIHEPSS